MIIMIVRDFNVKYTRMHREFYCNTIIGKRFFFSLFFALLFETKLTNTIKYFSTTTGAAVIEEINLVR